MIVINRLGLLILFLVLISAQPSDFKVVIDNASSADLKNRLKNFENNGIEGAWSIEFAKDSLVESAMKYKGVRYRSGGTTEMGMDCSGLMYRSAKDIGLDIPHQSGEIARYGVVVPTRNELQRGDFVFFKGRRLISHVGLMINEYEFIHASSSSGCVITNINEDSYWRNKFLFGTR